MTDDIFEKILARFGREDQLKQTQEECAELIVAISHYNRGKVSDAAIIEEGVDVELMIEQIKLITNDPETWAQIREEKINRVRVKIGELPR